jgi:hypothetical protein
MIVLDKSPQLGKGILHLALDIKVILFGELYVGKVVLKRPFRHPDLVGSLLR